MTAPNPQIISDAIYNLMLSCYREGMTDREYSDKLAAAVHAYFESWISEVFDKHTHSNGNNGSPTGAPIK